MAEQSYGDWIRSNPALPTKKYKKEHMDERDYKAINDELKREHHIGDTNEKVTAVEWLFSQIPFEWSSSRHAFEALQQAKQMEKERHDKWNKFLETEKMLGISDVKTIERIQWYYNQYYNETFKK